MPHRFQRTGIIRFRGCHSPLMEACRTCLPQSAENAGLFYGVLSLYHDQGHIATKTLDFDRTISITNGMPILRTSVDHGTAFDIAGKGIVSEISMAEAILLAAKYAPFFVKA